MKSKKRSLFLAAAMTLGVAGFSPVSFTFAAERGDMDEWVKYDDVPRAVRRAIDSERGKNEVKRIDHVRRNGHEFYRATIDTRGSDLVVRIDPDGKVLGTDEARDKNDRDYRGVERNVDRGVERNIDRAADTEREIRFADLPREVQRTVESERGNRDIKSIYSVHRDGRVFYRVIINERGREDQMLRISEGGKVLGDKEIADIDRARTASGVRRGLDDFDHDRVAFDRLPGEVKSALGREAGSGRVTDVIRYRSRSGHDVYQADVDNGGRVTQVRVDDRGRVLSESDATPEGRVNVRFEELPGAVKDAIGRDVRRDDIRYISQITRDGKTFYRVAVDKGRDRNPDYLTVSESGRIVNDLDRR